MELFQLRNAARAPNDPGFSLQHNSFWPDSCSPARANLQREIRPGQRAIPHKVIGRSAGHTAGFVFVVRNSGMTSGKQRLQA
jgi:hypothetical protein